MFLFRKRTWNRSVFLEFFLEYANNQLCLPPSLPQRFHGRIIKTFYMETHECHLVDSQATKIIKQSLEDIQKNGVWASYQDTVSRGSYMTDSGQIVLGKPTFYGILIDPSIYYKLYTGILHAYSILDLDLSCDPYVVYHGTARSSVSEIIKNGFLASFGMLGNAIYFGTFWKAFRFATRTQDYKKREGAILRVYAFWNGTYIRSLDSEYCGCEKCKKSSKTDAMRLADHDSIWSKFYDAVHVLAGGPLKNEEYACLNNDKLLIVSVGHAVSNTEHHEPLLRDLSIL